MAEAGAQADLHSLDDLQAAMSESVGGKCDRCRRVPATLRLQAKILPPVSNNGTRGGMVKALVHMNAAVCEPCGSQLFGAIARAVGQAK